MQSSTVQQKLDRTDLEHKVKAMYRDVALNPRGAYHFEMGHQLALKLGYQEEEIQMIPDAAIESFAGVGYFFDFAGIKTGEKVLDLGSGSGMDAFFAAWKAGSLGYVAGVDMTEAQIEKANRLAENFESGNILFMKAKIEHLDFVDATFDVVISNGVINLSPYKQKVFSEIGRVLRPNGRMAIADIVSEKQMPDNIVCDPNLWASCIGGAAQEDSYKQMIENAGMKIVRVKNNSSYQFLSKSARGASGKYGVKSVTLLAQRK